MDDSLENPMLRFKAFWVAMTAMIAVAAAAVVYRAVKSPSTELDDGAAAVRLATLQEARAAEEKAVAELGLTYHPPEGGHLTRVTVPDAIIEKAVAALQQRAAAKTELLIPGSKTFLEQQAGTHDPTESAFLQQ